MRRLVLAHLGALLVLCTRCTEFAARDDDAADDDGGSSSSSSSSGNGGSSSSSSSASSSSSSSSGTVDAGSGLSERNQTILDGLNAVRAAAEPTPAPPLTPLVWNASAEATLQTWADACDYVQPPVNGNGKYAGDLSPQNPDDIVRRLTTSNFVYASNTCSTGSCGPHKATLARGTTSVACAMAVCTGTVPPTGGTTSDYWELWSCVLLPGVDTSELPY